MLLAMSSATSAAPLVTRRPDTRADGGPAGIARMQTLDVDRAALATLRTRSAASVDAFPLGEARTVALDLQRVEPFAPNARLVVMEAGGPRALPIPDDVYFAGTVRGEPDSRVLLVATTAGVRGLVAAGGDVHRFGADAAGRHRSYAMADVPAGAAPPPGDFCGNDFHPALTTASTHARALRDLRATPQPLVPRAPGDLRQVDVAIETDQELRANFPSDDAALAYLADLVAASNVIYERDVAVRLRLSYVRLWSTTDPWTTDDTYDALIQFKNHWLDPQNDMPTVAGSWDLVHFVSAKGPNGGIAYIDVLCGPLEFGLSQVFGDFDVTVPSLIWDVLVFTHELGHNLGSPHTHCYDPPIDRCYNQENGCYSGPVVSTSNGTVMSYCHLTTGGYDNIDLLFGERVNGVIDATVSAATCLDTVHSDCGNGALDDGEACDDGNTVAGDGCSSSCTVEVVCGDGVQAGGEQCDDGNTQAGDGCSAGCRPEVCGSGVVDPGEACDDGNTAGGDGCSPACSREPRCGDGIPDDGEACDDGNTASGDGCSAACVAEPCTVVQSHQTLWAPARLTIVHGAADKLVLKGGFGIPTPPGGLGLDTKGVRLHIANAAGETKVDAVVPAAVGWTQRSGRWRYKDASGAGGGIRSLVVRERPGGITEVKLALSGRGAYPIAGEDLPIAVTLVLGDAASGAAGFCGRIEFGSGRCLSKSGGRKIACS